MNHREYSAFIALRDTARMPTAQAVALDAFDKRQSARAAKERIARLAYCCAILAVSVAIFYSI